MEEDPKKHTRHSEGVRLQEIPCGREGPKCLESMAAYVEILPFTQYFLRLSSVARLCSRQQGYKSVKKNNKLPGGYAQQFEVVLCAGL